MRNSTLDLHILRFNAMVLNYRKVVGEPHTVIIYSYFSYNTS